MKTLVKLALASSAFLLISNSVFADVSKTASYKNQRGSVMNLEWSAEKDKAGTLSGTFTTAVSNNKCKDVVGKPAPVSGVYVGNAVALTVSYPGCDSVLAMSGNVDKDRSEMNLHWLLTRQGQDTVQESWDTTLTGVDHFKKQP